MTITVHEDIVEGASFAISPTGPSATRIFKVQITDPETETMPVIMITPPIPAYGEIYPGTGGGGTEYDAIYAFDIGIQPEAGDNYRYIVTASYSPADASVQAPSESEDACIIQIGSSVSAGKTQKDNTGTQIVVTLTGQPDQVGDVDIQIPETVISFERREAASPLTKSSTYGGRVNSTSVTGFAARTLLCLGIDGNSSDGGITWVVTYRFQYKVETWDAGIVYIDPETDRPHNDVVIATNTGYVVTEIYPTADFNDLALPW